MVKIILDHIQLTQDEFKPRLDYLSKKMKGNPLYLAFQDQVAAMDAHGLAYGDALFTAKDGGPVLLKNELRAEINVFLKKFARKVEAAADDLPTEAEAMAFAKGTGFTVLEQAEKKVLTFLEVPNNFTVVDYKPSAGACLLSWSRVTGAKTYLIEELDSNSVWQNRGISNKTSILMFGTESEVKRTFRISALGSGTLVSACTNGVSVWVH